MLEGRRPAGMVEALRAALRLLPRPGPCGRAARAHPQSQSQQQGRVEAVLGSLAASSQAASCERAAFPPVSGLARFARAFLSYVGVGLSVVAATELAGLSVVHARFENSGLSCLQNLQGGFEFCASVLGVVCALSTALTADMLVSAGKSPTIPPTPVHLWLQQRPVLSGSAAP